MNLAASLQGLPNLSAHPRVQREVQRAVKYLPTAAVVLLLAIIAWQLARITWLLLPAPANDAVVIAQPIDLPKGPAGINPQTIANAHLFGAPNASDTTDINSAPQTQMTLVLAGVLAAPDPTKGFAFVGESAAMAKFHRVGDVLGGSAKLHSVYVDRVMLDRGGRLESLMLPRLSASLGAPPPMASATPPPARFADNVRRIAETNPSAFSEIVRPQPVFTGNKLQGYRVYPGRNRQQFARLGLHPGDIVTAVSGTPLTDQSSAMQIFNTISSTDRVTLTIEREGQSQQLTVNTAQIELPDPNAPPAAANPTVATPTAAPNAMPPGVATPQQVPPGTTPPPNSPAVQRNNPTDGPAGAITPEVQ